MNWNKNKIKNRSKKHKNYNIPLMILPYFFTSKISKKINGFSSRFIKFIPGLKYDLIEAGIGFENEEYISFCIINSLIISILFSIIFFIIMYIIRLKSAFESIITGLLSAGLIFLLLLLYSIKSPKIIAGKRAEIIDKNIVFALKDIQLQVNSGVSLYHAMINISNGNYGPVSQEIGKAAKSISAGRPMERALEEIAKDTKSDYLKKTIWQIVNTLKAGASLKGALNAIISDLTLDHKNKINNYAKELNLWALIYMLFAVAIPTIGSTLLIILSSFAGFGISESMFVLFFGSTLLVQYILIGFIQTRRPITQL